MFRWGFPCGGMGVDSNECYGAGAPDVGGGVFAPPYFLGSSTVSSLFYLVSLVFRVIYFLCRRSPGVPAAVLVMGLGVSPGGTTVGVT